MRQTDRQFGGFLRLVIRDLEAAIAENDPEKKQRILKDLLTDMRNTLEE